MQLVCQNYYFKNLGFDSITWQRDPPAASHVGGVWERQIHTARNSLISLLVAHERSLSEESLRTQFVETKAILNSWPLTFETVGDVKNEHPLSLTNILTMKTKVVIPPPGGLVRDDVFSRKLWRRIQHITNEFWKRWRKEFQPSSPVRSGAKI